MEKKCVIVLLKGLPTGLSANAAGILGITMGKELPELVGEPVMDGDERIHLGIVEKPIPVLGCGKEELRELLEKLETPEYADVVTADFTQLAQRCKTYWEYIEKMAATPGRELVYTGIALCGERKKVDKLTGSLALLR